MTFLKVSVESIDGLWISDLAAFRAVLPSGLKLSSNDLANQSQSKLSSLRAPSIEFQAFSTGDLRRHWLEVASARAGLTLKTTKLVEDWEERISKQQHFIRRQDDLTKRAVALYDPTKASVTGIQSSLPIAPILISFF